MARNSNTFTELVGTNPATPCFFVDFFGYLLFQGFPKRPNNEASVHAYNTFQKKVGEKKGNSFIQKMKSRQTYPI